MVAIGFHNSWRDNNAANAVPRYRMPAHTSLVDRDDVSEAKSPRSMQATDNPRDAASKAIPAPVAPPPITNKSNTLLGSCNRCNCSSLDGIPRGPRSDGKGRRAKFSPFLIGGRLDVAAGCSEGEFVVPAPTVVERLRAAFPLSQRTRAAEHGGGWRVGPTKPSRRPTSSPTPKCASPRRALLERCWRSAGRPPCCHVLVFNHHKARAIVFVWHATRMLIRNNGTTTTRSKRNVLSSLQSM